MLRAVLIYLSRAKLAQNLVMHWRLARRVALRFVAGETVDDAVAAVRSLNALGLTATLDVLGESIDVASDAEAMKDQYLQLIERIAQEQIEAWVSLKLTALGLDIDAELCQGNMLEILSLARKHAVRVTIDMEDHPYTQRTLDMLRALRKDAGFDNVRGVIQAYLYRSDEDIEMLAAEGYGIRLCKGAYNEPPEYAYPQKADTDQAMLRQTQILLAAAAAGRGYPGIATHDDQIISAAKDYASEHDIPQECYEFQMLYGVRSGLQEQLVGDGYGMRVYVPYGTQWYAYFMRRLAERPANIWFFVSNFFRR